jgi:DNA-binding NarL/FixJ family response regulator
MKVMLADDSDYVRLSLTKMLSQNPRIDGIVEAETICKAKNLLDLETPDVLILDLSFPEGSGFDILSYAREHQLVKNVIILTNNPSEPMMNKSYREGADFFFDKSNEFMKVIDVINKLTRELPGTRKPKADGGMEELTAINYGNT